VTAHPQPDFKTRAERENFPVAGWFLPRHLRPAVRAYYAFAREADDIADATTFTVIEKLTALDALEGSVLKGYGGDASGHAAGLALRERGLPLSVATDLLIAFRADARNSTIKTLTDLMDYCRHSAAPVGRFLLGLHGEHAGFEESEALCAALQILNHVQDARKDIDTLKRCYIPLAWLEAEGIALIDLLDPNNLSGTPGAYEPIRDDYAHGDNRTPVTAQPVDDVKVARCLHRMLDQAEHLLVLAQPLPKFVTHRGLAAQSAMVLQLAQRLLTRLRDHDPWAQRISLTGFDWFDAALTGLRVRVLGP
jgi:phytoene/squalene synthetase